MISQSQRSLLPIALFLLTSALLLSTHFPNKPTDYIRFWMVGHLHEHTEIPNIYAKNVDSAISGYVSTLPDPTLKSELEKVSTRNSFSATPALYMMIHLLSTDELNGDYRNFRLVSALFAALGLVTLLRLRNTALLPSVIAIVFFTLLFWPVRFDIRWGNTGLIQLGLYGLLLLFLNKNWLTMSGLWLGFFVLFKPIVIFVPVSLFALWIFQKEIKKFSLVALGFGLGGLLTIGLSTFYWGSFCTWTDWTRAVFSNVRYAHLIDSGPFVSKNNFIFHSSWLFYLAAGFTLIFSYRQSKRENSHFLVSALSLSLFLISGPIVQMHYFVLAIPLLLYVWPTENFRNALSALLATTAALLMGIQPNEIRASVGVLLIIFLAVKGAYTDPTRATLTALSQNLHTGKKKTR